jgi:uncharacterized protein
MEKRMSDPVFGLSIERVDNEPRPAVGADLSVVGLVGTAPGANSEVFPYNTPVALFSDETSKILALGLTGTLAKQIDLINAQLGEYQVAARIVIVRVEEGDTDDETMANIIGSSGLKTGLWALPLAGPMLGVIPRLIGVPGYTYQQYSGLAALALGTQGSNLTEAPTVVFSGGGNHPNKVLPTAHVVMGTGDDADKAASLVIDTVGSNLSGSLTVSFTGGGSDEDKVQPTATATLALLANPVVAALRPVLTKLIGHAVVSGPHSTLQAFNDWRETIQDDRIIPVETWAKAGSPATDIDSIGTVLGIAVRRDHEKGGRPFHSWANQPVYGIVGPNRPIDFSLTDGTTEGQAILALNGGVILRGEAGVETAIASGGFVYVGTDNAGEDELWRFYNVMRGRDYVHLTFLKTLRYYLGRFNLKGQTIEAVLSTMTTVMRDLQADGDILGFKIGFTRDQNNPENLRRGRFTIDFAAEEAPVLRYLGIRSSRYRPALDALLDDLLTTLDQAA